MEAIAMGVTNEDITSVRYINAIGKTGDLLVTDAIEEGAILLENSHAMTLKIAHIEIVV